MALSSTSNSRSEGAARCAFRVVLVDSDRDFRNGLAENLRDDGHTVDELDTPTSLPAIESFDTVAALITEYEFPNGTGVALLDQINAAHPGIAIVLLTTHRAGYIDSLANCRNFLHVVRKPLDYDDLHSFIHTLIDGRRH
jgi:DNA-binding NtrC family response regulator